MLDIGDNAPLDVAGLSVRYSHKADFALQDISYCAPAGRMIAVLGPNGAGKSTFVKAIVGLIPCEASRVAFFGADLSAVRNRVAYMAQRQDVDWSFPVRVIDVVLMGLSARIGWFKRVRGEHRDLAMGALEKVQMEHMAMQQVGALSGGQQQRVFLARALVQDPALYLLDEPLAGVDVKAQEIILNVLDGLKAQGKTIIAVHHDLLGAAEYFDCGLLLNGGVIASGDIDDVLATENIEAAYGVTLKKHRAHA